MNTVDCLQCDCVKVVFYSLKRLVGDQWSNDCIDWNHAPLNPTRFHYTITQLPIATVDGGLSFVTVDCRLRLATVAVFFIIADCHW
jgi:hypothetical protein